MTDAAINSLPAGSELDAEIGRRVFGFWQGEWHGETDHWFGGWNQGIAVHAFCSLPGNLWGPSLHYHGLPKFSTDDSAALQVVARLRELGWKADLRTVLFSEWEVVLVRYPASVEVHFVETLPLAVCRAALLAMRERVVEQLLGSDGWGRSSEEGGRDDGTG